MSIAAPTTHLSFLERWFQKPNHAKPSPPRPRFGVLGAISLAVSAATFLVPSAIGWLGNHCLKAPWNDFSSLVAALGFTVALVACLGLYAWGLVGILPYIETSSDSVHGRVTRSGLLGIVALSVSLVIQAASALHFAQDSQGWAERDSVVVNTLFAILATAQGGLGIYFVGHALSYVLTAQRSLTALAERSDLSSRPRLLAVARATYSYASVVVAFATSFIFGGALLLGRSDPLLAAVSVVAYTPVYAVLLWELLLHPLMRQHASLLSMREQLEASVFALGAEGVKAGAKFDFGELVHAHSLFTRLPTWPVPGVLRAMMGLLAVVANPVVMALGPAALQRA